MLLDTNDPMGLINAFQALIVFIYSVDPTFTETIHSISCKQSLQIMCWLCHDKMTQVKKFSHALNHDCWTPNLLLIILDIVSLSMWIVICQPKHKEKQKKVK